ncbi:MAG: HepT-like ribonuclease domain-containing protein [Chloroflexota bacterium]|nr:HepT-like ribonuclease domain-containing protein [Chloroflexota bacterium]
MLDHEAITARLDKLSEYGKILKELRKASRSEFIADYHVYGLAERYLQLSIECLLDIGGKLPNYCRS